MEHLVRGCGEGEIEMSVRGLVHEDGRGLRELKRIMERRRRTEGIREQKGSGKEVRVLKS